VALVPSHLHSEVRLTGHARSLTECLWFALFERAGTLRPRRVLIRHELNLREQKVMTITCRLLRRVAAGSAIALILGIGSTSVATAQNWQRHNGNSGNNWHGDNGGWQHQGGGGWQNHQGGWGGNYHGGWGGNNGWYGGGGGNFGLFIGVPGYYAPPPAYYYPPPAPYYYPPAPYAAPPAYYGQPQGYYPGPDVSFGINVPLR
jgi:hypothetical protein